jgi:hypothetical protein
VVFYELLTGRHLFAQVVSDLAAYHGRAGLDRIPVKVRPSSGIVSKKIPKAPARHRGHATVSRDRFRSSRDKTTLACVGAVAVALVAFLALSLIHFRENPLLSAPVQFRSLPPPSLLQGVAFAIA